MVSLLSYGQLSSKKEKGERRLKLQGMYPVFCLLSEEEQHSFMHAYREKRLEDLSEVSLQSAEKVNSLTDQEKALMKALGLTIKDLKTLKETF